MLLAANYDLHRLGHLHPNIFRDPRVEDVGCADAEGYASDCAHVGRVRVGADIQLPGERVALQHNRVADSFGTLAVFQFAVQLDSLLGGEVLLLQFELGRQI